MGAVDVGVGQQDHLVIPQPADVERVADAGAEGDDQRPDLLAAEHLVQAGLLDVEHLAEHGQDRLEPPVAALLR